MRPLTLGSWALLLVGAVACSGPAPTPPVPPPPAADPLELEVPAEPVDPTPAQLTGLPGIDRAQVLEMRILDARGTGRLGSRPIQPGQNAPMTAGEWLLADAGSEYEITLHSPLLPDGIVRLTGRSAFLIEPPLARSLPRFRVFAGHASFYLPNIPQGDLTVLTPAGPLVTHGAVFTVTVSPDFQVLVACREGSVLLTGDQNAEALPGQVLVADRLGRGRVYAMTPNEAQVFSDRWLKVMAEEAAPVLEAILPRRLAAWTAATSLRHTEEMRFLALWFREARTVLGDKVPGPEIWEGALMPEVRRSVWVPDLPAPGLLGELP